jgi:hypothetical protein
MNGRVRLLWVATSDLAVDLVDILEMALNVGEMDNCTICETERIKKAK